MVKLPSKSETAPWFCPWTTMLTPASGWPSSESVTEPEMVCACKPVETAIKAITTATARTATTTTTELLFS